MPRPIAISKNRTFIHVLDSQREDPKDERINWHLRVLPFAVRRDLGTKISAGLDGTASIDANLLERYGTAFKFGLFRISGAPFLDDTDETVTLEFDRALRHGVRPLSDECIARIPDDVIAEVGFTAWNLSSTGAATVGKSESPPTSPPDGSDHSAQHVEASVT